MKLTPLDAVFSSLVFFYNLGIDLSKLMTNYLQDLDPSQVRSVKDSLGSGVGISQFTHSLREMLEDMKISQQ